jgi:hypothetical protein
MYACMYVYMYVVCMYNIWNVQGRAYSSAIQATRKYLAPRHTPSQRTTRIGGSGTWVNLSQVYY